MDDYIESKAKLFASQTENEVAVLNWDDGECRRIAATLSAKLFPFSVSRKLENGVFLQDRFVTYVMDGKKGTILHADDIGIPGEHNVENALAASAIALSAGVDPDIIARELKEFRGVEHRLEYVGGKNGVTYVNGSKATNPAATIKDLLSFNQPIVLIAGGQERKMEYTELLPYFKERVRGVVTIGETRQKIALVAEAAGLSRVKTVDTANNPADTLAEAVRIASSFAEEGDVVLLSPACASWDMFASYEERGSIFKRCVHNL